MFSLSRSNFLLYFCLLCLAFVLIIKQMAIVLLFFPLSLQFKQIGSVRCIYAGILAAIVNTIWFWLAPPNGVTIELWLASTLLLVGIGFIITHIQMERQAYHKQIANLKRELRHVNLRVDAFRVAMPDRVFIYDQDGYCIDVISKLITPEAREELIGRHLTENSHILKPETSQQILDAIQTTISTGEIQQIEHQAFTTLEKEWRWFDGQLSPVKDRNLNKPWVVWVARDITERKRMEFDLEQVQHLANIGVWETDVQNNYVKWSEETYRIYGIEPEDFDHRIESVTGRFHPDDFEVFKNRLDNGINPYPLEYRIVHPDGAIRTVFAVGETIYDDKHQPIRRIGMVQDITDQKKAQQDHIQLQIAQQRTSTLHSLISNLTHDLMTPVTVIKTSAYILRQLSDEERIGQHVDKIELQLDILQKIVESLMLVSYLDDVQLDNLAPKSSNIMLLVHSLIQQYRSIMRDKQQTLVAHLHNAPVMMRYDHDYMQRALGNLFENAMEYTPEGGQIEVSVTLKGSQLEIAITDDGIGIPQEDQDRIFEPFYRGEKHRPVNGNSGLGLRITKLIIELHGGRISVKSAPEHGSTFQVDLPVI